MVSAIGLLAENQEPKMEDIIKLETNYSLAELKDLKVVDHVSRPNTFILEMLIESFLNDIIFHISITPTNLLLATLNASKGPTPDLLQTQQKYITVQRLTFARARWNNPTACIAALEGVPHVTPVN
uniref:Uncharacterized protein n=1 Tax=Oryza barthii TaxID=65489 RepID=A0A0D3GGW7_9ORYZ